MVFEFQQFYLPSLSLTHDFRISNMFCTVQVNGSVVVLNPSNDHNAAQVVQGNLTLKSSRECFSSFDVNNAKCIKIISKAQKQSSSVKFATHQTKNAFISQIQALYQFL